MKVLALRFRFFPYLLPITPTRERNAVCLLQLNFIARLSGHRSPPPHPPSLPPPRPISPLFTPLDSPQNPCHRLSPFFPPLTFVFCLRPQTEQRYGSTPSLSPRYRDTSIFCCGGVVEVGVGQAALPPPPSPLPPFPPPSYSSLACVLAFISSKAATPFFCFLFFYAHHTIFVPIPYISSHTYRGQFNLLNAVGSLNPW